MARLMAVAALLAFLNGTSHAQTTYFSYTSGKQYVVEVSREALEKSPAWKDDDENPPLSARRAIRLANAMKGSLVKDSDDYKWQFETAALTSDSGKWYWVIRYEAHFQRGVSSGPRAFLRIVVLMDGTVIKPVIHDFK
jgi:hypothetical protein